MAGARAIASMSATFSVAAGTLVVVAAVLAGPVILDCTKSPAGLAACLRERMSQSGLLSPDGDGIARPAPPASVPTVAEAPAVVEVPPGGQVPAVVAVPVAPGWIDANAGEYEPPAHISVELTASPGAVALADPAANVPAADAIVALAPSSVSSEASDIAPEASIAALPASEPPVSSAVMEASKVVPLELDATGQQTVASLPVAGVALEGPVGTLSAAPAGLTQPSPAQVVLAAPLATLSAVDAPAPQPEVVADVVAPDTGTVSALPSEPAPIALPTIPLAPGDTGLSAVGQSAAASTAIAALEVPSSTGTFAVTTDQPAVTADPPEPLSIPIQRPAFSVFPAPASPSIANIALLDAPGTVDATQSRAAGRSTETLVMLPRTGRVAGGAGSVMPITTEANLAPQMLPTSPVTVALAPPRTSDAIVNLDATSWTAPQATGGIGLSAPDPATVTLEAGIAPLPATPDVSIPKTAPLAPPSAQPELYPDVIVLAPPPNGSNSSFVMLKLN